MVPCRLLLTLMSSSDVVLLACRTELQLGSTVARQKHDSDSDVAQQHLDKNELLKTNENTF